MGLKIHKCPEMTERYVFAQPRGRKRRRTILPGPGGSGRIRSRGLKSAGQGSGSGPWVRVCALGGTFLLFDTLAVPVPWAGMSR